VLALCVVAAAALTLATRVITQKKDSIDLPNISLPRLRRAPFAPAKLLPALIPIVTSCFWLLYTLDSHKSYAIFPKWFYVAQPLLFYAFFSCCTAMEMRSSVMTQFQSKSISTIRSGQQTRN